MAANPIYGIPERGPAVGLLTAVTYAPGTPRDAGNQLATFTDVDTSNLAVSFTAPASGAVIVSLNAASAMQTAGYSPKWNLRDSGGDVAGTDMWMDTANNAGTGYARRMTYRRKITGLTPGVVYAWKWGFSATQTSAQAYVRLGPDFPATMEVWAA